MANRSLNKVMLIGNLTRDPELRYTPAGTAVTTFGLATNRSWVTQSGEAKEDTEFHRIVAWNKLGELCSQLLAKGRKVYVEGRLATHSWTGQDGIQHSTTEIVIEDMIILDSKRIVRENEDMKVNTYITATPALGPTDGADAGSKISVPAPISSSDDTDDTKVKKPVKKKTDKDSDDTQEIKKNIESVPVQAENKPVNEDITPDDIPF